MKKSKIVLTLLATAVMLAILIDPARYIKSASDGLLVFSINVLPALFPFMFLTKIMTELGVLGRLSKGFTRPMRRLFRVPASGCYIFLMSILSGYPIGAKLISEFYERGELTKAECVRLSSFCATSGPLFILGTIGTSMLFSLQAGILIFTAHVLSSLLNGVLFRFYGKKEPKTPAYLPQALDNSGNVLYDSIYNSVTSIMIVGGFITLFYVLIDILNDYNVLYPLEFLLAKLLGLFQLQPHAAAGLANGLIEATRGCLDLSRYGLPLSACAVLCCFTVSFGGLSIIVQSLTYLAKCKVNALLFIAMKLSHALLATGLCALLFLIFPL